MNPDSYGVRVWRDDPLMVITWNGSATFNVWVLEIDQWRNVDAFTVYDVSTESEARLAAREWCTDRDTRVS